jgi:putative transposase
MAACRKPIIKKVTRSTKEVKRKKDQYYQAIKSLTSQYTVSLLCKILGVSRSGYYKWLRRQAHLGCKAIEDQQLKQLIVQCHQQYKGIYGYYRIVMWLKRKHALVVNHKRVYRLMKELNIQAKIRRKRRYFGGREVEKTVSTNVLNRDFNATRPNEKWVTDITYLQFGQQTLYLSVIYDLFNNEVIAYHISERNDLKLVRVTVEKAVKNQKTEGIVLHSDQGIQYTSRQYHELLQKYKMIPSMSRKGNCLDNACVENFFSHLKTELMYLHRFREKEEVKAAVDHYITFYNEERYQRKLGNLTPKEYKEKIA